MPAPQPFPRAGILTLAAALLLAVSGLFSLPEFVFSQTYYTDSWMVLAAAAPTFTSTTLILAAAAMSRGSQTFLLVVSAGTLLHLVALAGLVLPTSGGPTGRLWSAPVQLLLALVCLAMAWWTTRTGRRPWVPLVLVALAPLLGRLTLTSGYWDAAWWPVLVALDIPAVLTVLAAGLVCLPGRRPQIAGAVLIAFAGPGVYVSGLVLGDQPHPYQLATMGLALVCAVAGIVTWRARGADDDAAGSRPDGTDRLDAGAPAAPSAATDGESVTMSDTAVVVVPSPPAADEGAGPGPADPTSRTRTLTLAALTVLVLAVALEVPRMFAHGPGIRPAGAGLVPLAGLLVDAAVPAALVLAAGAATLRSRGALLTATVGSGLLAIALLVSRTAAGGTITLEEGLPFVALGLSVALAWTGLLRPGADSTAWRWTAVVPLVLAAPSLRMLIEPGVTMHASDPAFVPQLVLPILVSGLGPLLAAALLCFPHRRARIAGAALLGVVAIVAVIGAVEDAVLGLRILTALNLLEVGGYALSAVLVVSATLAPRTGR